MIPIDTFELWLKNKGLKDRSIKNYTYYFARFRFPRFNQESVSRFLSEPAHRNTIARAFLINLQECMTRNHQELGLDAYQYKEISDVFLPKLSGRKSTRLINPLTEEEIKLLEAALETEQLKVMLLLCYHAGLRLGELVKIRLNSFNWDLWKRDMSAMGEVKVFGKGDKEGIAVLPVEIMRRISNFIRSEPGRYKGVDSKLFNLGPSSFQKYLYAAGIKAGITQKKEDGTYLKETIVHPHRLRHSYAHNLMIKGVDIRYIKEAVRHSSIQSTQIYTRLSTKELKDKLQAVN